MALDAESVTESAKQSIDKNNMTPTIETARLILVPYTAGMVTYQHIGWLNDKEVVKYSEQRHHRHSVETQHSFLNQFPIGSHIWLICLKQYGEEVPSHIGTATAYIDQFNLTANLGIMIGNRHKWGKGYGTEAWKAMMDRLFMDGIQKIEAGMMLANEPMISLCKKIDMVLEGVKPRHFLVDGVRRSMVQYGLWK